MPPIGLLEAPRSPVKRPAVAAPRPPAAAQPPPPLPPHLQHAVHQALADLQAQRLLYPQQCAAAEAEGASARQEAEQRVTAALGPFSYTGALSDLDAARQAAKQLARRRSPLHSQDGGASAGGSLDSQPLPAAPAPADEEEALWAGFEAFSAAVAAEVDRRIASARLHPPAPAAIRGQRLRHLQQRRLPQQPAAACEPSPGAPTSRQPLGSLQQQEAPPCPAVAAKPAGAQRKRERSPQALHQLPAAPVGGERKGPRQQAAGRQAAAVQHPAASPSSKRSKPHVAFGTRCDAPRPAQRSSRPVKLEAAAAPTPPQLPPAQPEGPAKPPARSHADAAGLGPATAAGPPPASKSDLLRSLTAALAGNQTSSAADPAGPLLPPQIDAAAEIRSAGLQRVLADLTAALQGAQPSSQSQPQERASSGAAACLPAALLHHGMEPSVLQDASSLLQAVLDGMDGMEQRAAAQAMPASGSTSAAPAAAAAAASSGLGEQSSLASAPNSPSAQQLCDQFSRLLQAGGAGLQEVQQELGVMQQAEAAAQRMEAAATRAALAGIEAAAHAAEQAAGRQLAAVEPPASRPSSELDPGPPAAQGSGPDQAGAAPAAAQQAQQEQRSTVLPLTAAAEPAVRSTSSGPASPSMEVAAAAPSLSAVAGGAEQHAADAQQTEELPPAEPSQDQVDVPAPPAGAVTATASPSAHGFPADEPAAGWPVQWQPPVAPGIPLLLPPPAAAQLHWAVPAVGSCALQPAAALVAPQLGASPWWGQPVQDCPQQAQQGAAVDLQQAQQEAAVEWEPPFSVASDEELPDSPSSSGCLSPASVPGSRADGGAGKQPVSEGQQAAALDSVGPQLEAQREQAVLDELAALSIRQYQQHAHLAEDLCCGQLVAADGAWHAAAAGRGGSPLLSEGCPAADGEEDAAVAEQAAAAHPAPAAAAGAGERGVPAAHPAPASGGPTPALTSCPAAKPSLPRPPAPYQPLKAAAEVAAAARRQEEAAGWRRLRQKADELVLWHEYAAQLGISLEDAQPQEQQKAEPHSQVPARAPQPQPGSGWAAAQLAARQGAVGSWGAEQRLSSLPSPMQQRLWRPVSHRSEAASAAPPALASPLLVPSCDVASSEGSSTPASSSCLASEESSSLLSSAATSSSLGVAARHKARALRFRLLHRRLEQATGLRSLPLESGAPSESDCLSPSTDASLATPLACAVLDSGLGQPRLRRLREQPTAAVQATGVPLATSPAAAVPFEGAEQSTAPGVGEPAELWERQLIGAADAAEEAEAGLESRPSTAAGGSAAAASPPLDSHLADHLSSATPSECPTLGSRVPGGTWGREAAGLSHEADGPSGRPWRRISDSSCSTLREVSEVGC